MDVQGFNAATAKIGIYEIGNLHADSTMYSRTVQALEIIQKAGKVRDSFQVLSGQFTIAGKKDNLRSKVVAYLVDNAGNLGAIQQQRPLLRVIRKTLPMFSTRTLLRLLFRILIAPVNVLLVKPIHLSLM
jgi:hypothetical protein